MVPITRIVVTSLVLLLCSSAVLRAEVHVEPVIGFQHASALETWIPTWVRIANHGPDLAGELNLHVREEDALRRRIQHTTYSMPVNIPANSEQVYQSTVLYAGSSLGVEIIADDAVVFAADVELNTLPLTDGRFLVISDNPAGFEFIDALYLMPEHMPQEWLGYHGFDTVVLHQADLSRVTRSRIDALTTWASYGNTILVTGAGSAELFNSQLFRTLFTLQPGLKRNVDFGDKDVHPLLEGITALEVWSVSPGSGHTLWSVEDIPLLVGDAVGDGAALFLPFDPNAHALRNWDGKNALFAEIGARDIPRARQDQYPLDYLAQSMLNSVLFSVPTPFRLVALIALGLALLVVGCYYAASRYRLNAFWMLLQFVVLAVVSVTVLYVFIGQQLMTSNYVVTEVALIHKQPDGVTSMVEGYHTFIARDSLENGFSVQRDQGSIANFSVSSSVGFPDTLHTRIDPSNVRLAVTDHEHWQPFGFRSVFVEELPIFLQVHRVSDLLGVRIDNQSWLDVDRVVMHYNGAWFGLGQVPSGQSNLFLVNDQTHGTPQLESLLRLPPVAPNTALTPSRARLIMQNQVIREMGALHARSFLHRPDAAMLIVVLKGTGFEAVQLEFSGHKEFHGFWLSSVLLGKEGER